MNATALIEPNQLYAAKKFEELAKHQMIYLELRSTNGICGTLFLA